MRIGKFEINGLVLLLIIALIIDVIVRIYSK